MHGIEMGVGRVFMFILFLFFCLVGGWAVYILPSGYKWYPTVPLTYECYGHA